MEYIRVTCTKCGKTLQAPASTAGKKAICVECGNQMTVPDPEFAKLGPWLTKKTTLQSRTSDNYYICPNPNCKFKGNVEKEDPGMGALMLSALLVFLTMIPFAFAPSLAGKIITSKDPSTYAVLLSIIIVPLAILLMTSVTIFVTRIVQYVIGRYKCPVCGVRLG